jgi:serine/threonine protein kinase
LHALLAASENARVRWDTRHSGENWIRTNKISVEERFRQLESAPVSVQIASALDKAHRAGIAHRDLKPGNIMLSKGGAKLLDFGLAKQRHSAMVGSGYDARSENRTGPGVVMGTAQDMTPEQLEGRDADARTDLFAFGVVLFEMLTGKKARSGSAANSSGRILIATLRLRFWSRAR